MANLLLEEIQYKIEETRLGTWKRYLYPTGARFAEFTTHAAFFGLPLLHFTFGICPETGKRKIARGVIAIGRLSMGILALGQASMGVIALGQLGIGVLALAQGAFGMLVIGQLAVGIRFASGSSPSATSPSASSDAATMSWPRSASTGRSGARSG